MTAEICDVCGRCGREKGISFNATDAYKKCLGGAPCLERAYERSQAALAAARRECEGLRKALGAARAVIDRDRTGLAAGLNAAINATRSYWWIANGEWSGHHYTEQNEKTLRAEVKNAFEEIAATAAKALSESGRLASETCRTIDAALAAPAAGCPTCGCTPAKDPGVPCSDSWHDLRAEMGS